MQNLKSAPNRLWNTNMYYGTIKINYFLIPVYITFLENIICFHLYIPYKGTYHILLSGIHRSYILAVIFLLREISYELVILSRDLNGG